MHGPHAEVHISNNRLQLPGKAYSHRAPAACVVPFPGPVERAEAAFALPIILVKDYPAC